MRIMSAWTIALLSLSLAAGAVPARAQTASPSQIQAQIAGGDTSAALSELQTAVQLHPDSGVAWYLTAEAQDAAGHASAARAALAKAEQLAPGLPFANQQDVAALQAHVNAHSAGGLGAGWLVIAGLVILFMVFRLFALARRRSPMPAMPYGQPYASPPPYPYGPAPGYAPAGGGIGSALLTGLAAGAGLAAGERLIDDVTGQSQYPDQNQTFPENPSRDDGLQGNPGWDDNTDTGGTFDPGNNW